MSQPQAVSLDILLDELRAAGHLTGEVAIPEAEAHVSRWILALQVMGGWLASIFLLSFVGLGASAFVKEGGGWLVLGVATTVFAGWMLQKAQGLFVRQFLLPFSLAGQAAFAMGAVQLSNGNGNGWWLIAGFELAVCVLVAWPVHRFVAALAVLYAIQAAMLGHFFARGGDVWSSAWLLPIYWTAACALLVDETRWRTRKAAPLLTAVAAALAVHALTSVSLPLLFEAGGNGWVSHRLQPGTAQAALSLVSFVCLAWLGRTVWRSPRGILLLAALGGGLAVTWQSPGVGLGVATMALGFAHGRRWLLWLGGLVALAAIGRFYYFLPVDLLTKSGYLVLGGVLLLTVRVLLLKETRDVG